MSFQASCPTCGATVTFNVASSLVVVCEHCETVCGRGDGKLESYGKVADLVQTDSPLQIGQKGSIRGASFEIMGRSQLKHPAGGVWDEWYAAMEGGRTWAWVAEAQGRYYFTTPFKLPTNHNIPPLAELEVEDSVTIPTAGVMKVAETGEAMLVSGEGEIPFVIKPGETVRYADLSGAGRKFATLDESNGSLTVYLGGEYTLAQLGMARAASREQEAREVGAIQVSCPSCGGSLELRAPDQTERVCCPFCGSLHDANQGSLQFLRKLGKQKIEPLIPLGSTGQFHGESLTVIGFMQRRVTYEGRHYYWYEYLLYRPRTPFRWLIHSNNHWTLGQAVPAGAVQGGALNARYQGKSFRIYDRGQPTVNYVLGEFYWKVEIGEKVESTDFISPPYILSRELSEVSTQVQDPAAQQSAAQQPGLPPSRTGQKPHRRRTSREVNWTLGKYTPVEEVKKAFGLSSLPAPQGVAPNQPYPHRGVYRIALILFVVALLLGGIVFVTSSRREVFKQTYQLKKTDQKVIKIPDAPTFKLRGLSNIRVRCATTVRNKWAYIDGYFFNEATEDKHPLSMGVHPDQAGPGRSREKFFSALPGGEYSLQLDAKWEDMNKLNNNLTIQIQQGVPRPGYFMMLLFALGIPLVGVVLHHFSFSVRRWQESDFSPFLTNA